MEENRRDRRLPGQTDTISLMKFLSITHGSYFVQWRYPLVIGSPVCRNGFRTHAVYQSANSLNRSMQGLWSAHRKTKVNLNAQTPPDITTPPSESSLNRQVERLGDADSQAGPSAQDASLRPTDGAKRKPRSTRGNDLPNKRQKGTSVISSMKDHPPPSTRLSDLGGVQPCIEKMLELVAMPLCHPEVYLHTGVQPPRGVLLHGPPGCGKTLLANAIAGVSNDFLLCVEQHLTKEIAGDWRAVYKYISSNNRLRNVRRIREDIERDIRRSEGGSLSTGGHDQPNAQIRSPVAHRSMSSLYR